MITWKACGKHEQDCKNVCGRLKGLFGLGLLIVMFCGCADMPQGKDPGIVQTPVKEAGLLDRPHADSLIMKDGISWLGQSERPADYERAREIFQALKRNYPDSEWRLPAEMFIHLIDALQSAQAQIKSGKAQILADQALVEKLKQENEQLKKEIHTLGSRYQSERAGLIQENEQLKKDMELLKKLEIQMDRREKMLR